MRTRLALLFYRISEWFDPSLYGSPYVTLKEIEEELPIAEKKRDNSISSLHHTILARRIYTLRVFKKCTELVRQTQ